MLIDILIIVGLVLALWHGRQVGLVRQLFSVVGFFSGLFLGAWLEPYTVSLGHNQTTRTAITLVTTLGSALLFLSIGEYVGLELKRKVTLKQVNAIDNSLGAILGALSLLVGIWLTVALANTMPLPSIQVALQKSHIISDLDRTLPQAPTVIADLGHLIEPNGFPKVFIGKEPDPATWVTLPSANDIQNAVARDGQSVVKIEGQGCGGIVEGSGFVIGSGLVATNAHVVAGITHPYAIDGNGTHPATVVWFDPNLDFAVLRVDNLAGKSLPLSHRHVSDGTSAALLGYPGGGSLRFGPAAVLDEFTATGRNIYDQGSTNRDVYEIRADVAPGNSGGPLIATDGSVIGVVFAESTSYNQVGYALTTAQISGEINKAAARNQPVSTGNCAD